MQQQLDVFVASLTTFWTQLAGFVPQLLAALLLLFVGWLLANLARTGVTNCWTCCASTDWLKRPASKPFSSRAIWMCRSRGYSPSWLTGS